MHGDHPRNDNPEMVSDLEHLRTQHGVDLGWWEWPEVIHDYHVQAHEDERFIGPPHEHP